MITDGRWKGCMYFTDHIIKKTFVSCLASPPSLTDLPPPTSKFGMYIKHLSVSQVFVMPCSDSICTLFIFIFCFLRSMWVCQAERKRNDCRPPSEREKDCLFESESTFLRFEIEGGVERGVYIQTANWLWGWERDLCLALVNGRNWSQLGFAGQMAFSNLECALYFGRSRSLFKVWLSHIFFPHYQKPLSWQWIFSKLFVCSMFCFITFSSSTVHS